jgi:hypothetical protein
MYSFGIEVISCEFRRLQFCIRNASGRRQYSSSGCSQAGDLLNLGRANRIERALQRTTDAARCRQPNNGRSASAVRLPNRKLVAET